ncbi:glutathione S-transferase [Apodospora peruviana]|uniref:Glutathione S-transferase n=1 Tax=Apodospora peruviana TaxID=516989 RepID=A0AAE0HWJ4_9PEZI|nr:glutathione S-transferase [Apodospora peruviana]
MQRPAPTTVAQHLAGTAQSWHDKVSTGGPFPPEAGRYRLYIGLFCPFAHRANIVRHLKGLEFIIPVTIVKPYPKGDDAGWPGWQFNHPSNGAHYKGADTDPEFGAQYLHELYFKADPAYKGRYSVPVLWDTVTKTIVNNESAELLRDLQTSFDTLLPESKRGEILYPVHLREKIDKMTEWMQRDLNLGVYKAGFATTQADYDVAVPRVFAALNVLEKTLAQNGGPYILGQELTELDVRAYATVVRFDTVYVQHFKCNLGMIRHDYPQLKKWLAGLYYSDGEVGEAFKETTDFKHIKENYTKSHKDINPRAITPMGPWPDVEPSQQGDDGKKVGGVKMRKVLELEKKLLMEVGFIELAREVYKELSGNESLYMWTAAGAETAWVLE